MLKKRNQHKHEMYALIRKWESSGQSQSKFLDQSGISKNAFGYWRKRYLEDERSSQDKPGKLIPINVSSDNNPSIQASQSIEIIYPNGVRLLCPTGMDLVRALRD